MPPSYFTGTSMDSLTRWNTRVSKDRETINATVSTTVLVFLGKQTLNDCFSKDIPGRELPQETPRSRTCS